MGNAGTQTLFLDGKTLLPGLIDSHVHPTHHKVGHDPNLLRWLEKHAYPEEIRFQDPSYAFKVSKAFVDQSLGSGTTHVVANGSYFVPADEQLVDLSQDRGLGVTVGTSVIDTDNPRALRFGKQTLEQGVKAAKRIRSKYPDVSYGFAPRSAWSTTPKLLVDVAKIAKTLGLSVQSHLAEEPFIGAYVRKQYGDESETSLFDRCGILGCKPVLAHGLYTRPVEKQTLVERGATISLAPLGYLDMKDEARQELRRQILEILGTPNLEVGLGTDSAGTPSTGYPHGSTLLHAVRALGLLLGQEDAIPVEQGLYHATLGGAKAAGVGHQKGSFHPGKQADFVVLDGSGLEVLRAIQKGNARIQAVYTKGKARR